MSDELIARMRARIEQLQRVISLAHDPRIVEIVQNVIDTGEADIRRMEAEGSEVAQVRPPPIQH